jgi:hypothetical protein
MNEITEALDALGLALAEHGHVWTDRERQLYESAVAICGGYTGTDLLASEKSLRQKPCCKPRQASARA